MKPLPSAKDVEIAAEIYKSEIEAAGGRVALEHREPGMVIAKTSRPDGSFHESFAFTKYGVTPISMSQYASREFRKPADAAYKKAKKWLGSR